MFRSVFWGVTQGLDEFFILCLFSFFTFFFYLVPEWISIEFHMVEARNLCLINI